MSYYIKSDGTRRTFAEISQRIEHAFPDLVGKHIFVQLDALGLREEFRLGETPRGLPYSFSEGVSPLGPRLERVETSRNV